MPVLTIEGSSVAKRAWLWVLIAVVAAWAVWSFRSAEPSLALSKYESVVALSPAPAGLDWTVADSVPSIAEAADGTDPGRLRAEMQQTGIEGLWVQASPGPTPDADQPLRERLASGGIVRGFRGEVLTSDGLLYLVDETEWPVPMTDRVLARVARGILEGSDPPPLDAFPKELLEPQPVEVLVVLVSGRGPRLWRSAKATSIADGLVTAAVAARKRWEERTETMGGPLAESLDQLDVHVALLFDDGTFDSSAVSLIDSLVKPGHGVAYEQPSRWRYLLPRATQNAATPSDAYRRLFRDNGLPEESFDRRDLRLYRMRMQTVSVDQGSAGSR
jgi:hypothetical protein